MSINRYVTFTGEKNNLQFLLCTESIFFQYYFKIKYKKLASVNNSHLATRDELAKQFGMDESQLRNYKRLLTLIPEFQNAIKLAKCIVELERIYGINHGGDRKSKPNNSVLINQENLAKQFGMSVDGIQNYKKLLTLIPEFQDAIKLAKCIVELERIYGINHGGDRKSNTNNFNLITENDFAKQIGVSQQQLQNYKKLLTLIPEFQDAIKLAKCIVELERIYGIRNGGDRKSELNNSTLKTQNDLAKEFGMDKTQLINYKKLLTLIPEFQDAIKLAKCISELERIYGIRQGSAGKVKVLDTNNFNLKTQNYLYLPLFYIDFLC